jgi:dipeptidyl aminopeptidase/acylaminoacyl peptidase
MLRFARIVVLLVGVWSILAVPAVRPASAEKRTITEKDLLRFTWAADPQISPDGGEVAFVQVTVQPDKDSYATALWLVSTHGGSPRRLTNGPGDSEPRWSPDGKSLVFVRSAEKDGKGQPPQLYLLPLSGGEPRALTSLPKGAGSPKWSPDGKKIAFLSTTQSSDLAKQDKPKERVSDVRVITRSVYRMDNAGYIDPDRPAHIWNLSVPEAGKDAEAPKQVTTGEFTEAQPAWSPDGAQLYFISNRRRDPSHYIVQTELYVMPSAGGEFKKISGVKGSISRFSLGTHGKRIAFRGMLGDPVTSYTPPALYVVDATPGAEARRPNTSFDFDIGGRITGDQAPPRGGVDSRPLWAPDSSSVIDVVSRNGRANLERFSLQNGVVTPVTKGDHEVSSFSASADGTKLALLISTPTNIGDIFLADSASGSLKQLTHVNAALFDELNITPPEEIEYASFDGKKIPAWIQKPPDFDAKKKYPMILNIHGGPHAAYGYTFFHEMQWMAAKGYVVLYPNPRGSSSYGQEFGNIIQYRYPGDDYKDLMAGVDELIRRGYVDPKRLAVTGGSGGGLLTNWVITQTDRFAAAASQRSIADWSAWWYTADFTLYQARWFKEAPFRGPAEYVERSPLTYIEKVKTPLMLIEGEADYRTPPAAGGEAMFRALNLLKKPAVMVRFPGESHELSRSGKPWHRIERLQHIVNWFDKYLQGRPMPQYDMEGRE